MAAPRLKCKRGHCDMQDFLDTFEEKCRQADIKRGRVSKPNGGAPPRVGVEKPPPARIEIFDAIELGRTEFPPVKTVVPGIFVEGLTLFCGKPKLGKSWLLLHAAHAMHPVASR
jgi:hypothetical protein